MILATFIAVVVITISAILFKRIVTEKRIPACGVSRAHLTCDPGDYRYGYNAVVAIINFANQVAAEVFIEQFLGAIVENEMCFRLKMRFEGDCMSWAPADSTWIPNKNIIIHEVIRRDSLQDLAGTIISSPLDLGKPAWELHFVESVIESDGVDPTSSVILKYHHAMADGFTMIQRMVGRIRALDASKSLADLFPHSRPVRSNSISLPRKVWAFLASTVSILRMKADPPGLLRSLTQRKPGEPINVSFSDLLSLEAVKRIALDASRKLVSGRVTVNDVLTSIITRALRLYALRNSAFDPQDITSVVWVSLNKDIQVEEEWDNANLGFAYVKLPLSKDDPWDCVTTCHQRLHELKSSTAPVVINTTLRLLGSLPISLSKQVSKATADVASVSMSNLIGPNAPVYWPVSEGNTAGSGLVDSVYFATSPPFRFGPLVSIMSYCGTFYLSISARDSLLSKKDLDWITCEAIKLAIAELVE